jgi:multidrug efflux pump subunit AcrA (membrane-fusion protein)
MEPDVVRPTPLRRPLLAWSLAALAFAVAGLLGWKLLNPASNGDPVATSLLAFEKQNRLTVFSAQLAPVVAADDERLFGMLKSRQVAVIPARVDYTLDLSNMNRSRMTWDAEGRKLVVVLPPLHLSKPNLDEARAQYLREGVWITRDAQASLTRDNTLLAERLAARQAANPALLELARGAARDAVRQNLAIPLEVAGFDTVTVSVRFDGEPQPPA